MKRNIFVMLTVLLVMVGTLVFGATFSDVKGTKYQDAVDLLTTLKIVNGKTTTSFAPNDNVKRSEMAKMLVIALGKESEATKATGKTKFPDVVENHWATGYINVATELGLIKGYPDGTFAADDNVSYVEAITMLLRALSYEDVNNLVWPTGYIERGKNIGLVKNVTVSNYDAGAIRGDIAILVENTLMANTREIIGSDSKGMIYGNGAVLISKSFSNYLYFANTAISDIDEENGKITLTDSSNKKQTLKYSGKDILELYGKDVTALYDKSGEKFLEFTVAPECKTVHGTVTKVSKKEIYIKKVAYTLPASSKIKLIGISDIADAEEAYLTVKNDVVTHVVAIGEEDLYVGIATSKSAKSGSVYKVTLMDLEGEKDTFTLADQSATIKKNEIVIYALNDDDELVIRYRRDADDGLAVESVSKTALKLKGKTQYTFSSSDKLVIVEVDDGEIAEKSALTSINKKYDTALVIESQDTTFVIYFVDGLEDNTAIVDDNASATKAIAKKRLEAAIKSASAKKEASYSVATYEKMLEKLDAAETILAKYSSATITNMDKASLALETAIENLSKATTSDKTLRSDFAKLEAKITEAKKLAKNTEYTEASRTALTKVITTSEKITLASTTSAKIQTAINNLNDAIDALVNTATEAEIADIKAEITDLLKEAKAKKEADYTKESYASLKEAITAAEAIKDYSKERISKLTNISNNLATAIKNLVSYNSQNLETAKKAYKAEKAKADKLDENNYKAATWKEVEKYLVDIDKEYKDVAEEEMATATAEIEKLTDNLKEAMNGLIYTEEYKAKEDLSSTIADAKKIKESAWSEEIDITFAEFQTKISDAEKLLKSTTASVSEIEAVEKELQGYINKI